MESFEQILPYLVPIVLLVWVVIGIFILRQKINMNIDHSHRLKRGIRRLNLGKTGSAGSD